MAKFKSPIRQSLQLDRGSVSDESKTSNFKISLAYFDPEPFYASGFKDWLKDVLLSKAMETRLGSQLSNKFAIALDLFVSLALPKILALGNYQINLLLLSTYSYLCRHEEVFGYYSCL